MAQIFVSYSRVDSQFVEQFIKRLQTAFPNHTIWHDRSPHGLIGGDNWWETILKAIDDSAIFIYILSNESVKSVYCQAEFTEARRLQKRIITIQARDRTDLTDELDDIQYIDMKNGANDADAVAQLTAAVNKQFGLAKKWRPRWNPATPKPPKEMPPTRAADAPDVTTPELTRPTAEQEALDIARKGLSLQRIAIFVGVVAIVASLLVALITIIPSLLERAENADVTQTAIALLNSQTPSILPTEAITLEIAFIVQTLDAQATFDQATLNAESTAVARVTGYAVGTQSILGQTATATLWTHTPMPNITASIEAYRTEQVASVTQTWIYSWTATPTPIPTATPSSTSTPTYTPTSTRTPTRTPTVTPSSTSTHTRTPVPTRTLTPTPTDVPQSAILYEEDFEDEVVNGWEYGWGTRLTIITDESGNKVWRSTGSMEIFLSQSKNWENYVVRIRYYVVDWDDGSIFLNTRYPWLDCGRYNLYVNATTLSMSASGANCERIASLGDSPIISRVRRWYTLYVEVNGSEIRWQFDDGRLHYANNSIYPKGGIGLLNLDVKEVWFDDILVWSLDQ